MTSWKKKTNVMQRDYNILFLWFCNYGLTDMYNQQAVFTINWI